MTEHEVGQWLLDRWWRKEWVEHYELGQLADAMEEAGRPTEALWLRSRPVTVELFLDRGTYRVLCVTSVKRRRWWIRGYAAVHIPGPVQGLEESERLLRTVGL